MQTEFEKIMEQLKAKLATWQVGRATPALIERTLVDSYGNKMPLQQLGSITSLDAQTLQVQPWDVSTIKAIEKALYVSVQNITVAVSGQTLRVHFAPLTMEKRQALVKAMKQQCEETHIMIKRLREDLLNKLKQDKKNNGLAEDVFFTEQKKIQKMVDDYNQKVKQIESDKEKVLLTV
ncbi:MAG: ribosome-recycling factor [Patescibacteria group bacterium]|jgi:ribosome recycling factor